MAFATKKRPKWAVEKLKENNGRFGKKNFWSHISKLCKIEKV